jgi:TonB-dependent receptor
VLPSRLYGGAPGNEFSKMDETINFRRPIGRRFSAILFSGAIFGSVWAAKPQEESDSIVSEKDSVKLLEDSTVSEAISRRPDLSFANVTIDGESSRRSLGSISADSVTSVEVMKAVTSDQDADSLGGSISLRSRPAYLQKALTTNISVSSVYESVVGKFGPDASISIGGPLNEAKTLGGRISLGYEKEQEGTQMMTKDWFRRNVDGESKIVLKEYRVSDNPMTMTDKDIGASLDFKVRDELRFHWRGSYRNLKTHSELPHYEYRLSKGKYESVDANGGNVSGALVERGNHGYDSEREQIESSIGADWDSEHWEADLKFTYQDAQYTPIDYYSMDFVQTDVDLRYDIQDHRFPQVAATDGKDLFNPENFHLEDFMERDRIDDESDTIVSSKVKRKDLFGSEYFSLRMGLKSRARDNVLSYESAYYDGQTGEDAFWLSSAFKGDTGRDLLEGNYRLDMQVDKGLADSYIADNFDTFTYDERRSRERSDASSYEVEEQVDAYFGMVDFNRGKWRSLVGMRQEDTSIAFQSNEVLLGKDALDKDGDGDFEEFVYLATNPTTGSSNYGHAFPNAHVRYRLNDRATFISSYTNTIQRPLYGDVVPYRRVDLEDREISEGNPDLRPTLYTNVDFSVDLKVGDEGMFSAELFEKAAEDYIFSGESIVSGGVYDGYERTRDENSSNAQIRGMSLTWNQPVHLPLLGDGLSFNCNYVKQETELEYPNRPGEVLQLAGHPDNEVKFTLSYEREKLFAQVKINVEDERIYRVGSSSEEDRYVGPRSRVDLSVSYNIQKKTRLYASWGNVTNQSYMETYEGDPSHSTGFRDRGWRIRTGVKLEL